MDNPKIPINVVDHESRTTTPLYVWQIPRVGDEIMYRPHEVEGQRFGRFEKGVVTFVQHQITGYPSTHTATVFVEPTGDE